MSTNSGNESDKDQLFIAQQTIINQGLEIERLKGQLTHYKEVIRSVENELSDAKVQLNHYQKLNNAKDTTGVN